MAVIPRACPALQAPCAIVQSFKSHGDRQSGLTSPIVILDKRVPAKALEDGKSEVPC